MKVIDILNEAAKDIVSEIRSHKYKKTYICSNCKKDYGLNEGLMSDLSGVICPYCNCQDFEWKKV